ncbi:MAG: AAA family ATPase [Patescibacteria group bacterium]|nr:AAA family ATPase [Patescibacteria group bacterium]
MISIIGHKKIIDFLGKSIENNRIVHAYLFVGPEYVGKTTVAKWFADKILNCRGFKRLQLHPDFTLVERERDEKTDKLNKDIKVDKVRDLISRLGKSSFLNSYKVALIPETEALNSSSANSLLKTLEEPKGKTVIILCAKSTENLLPTIVSRCQIINFSLVKKDEICEALIKSGTQKQDAKNFSNLSFGRPGKALNFLHDEESFNDYQAEIENCCELIKSNLSDRFLKLEGYFSTKMSLQDRVELLNKVLWIWSSLFRDVLYIKKGSSENISNYFAKERLAGISSDYSGVKIASILKSTEKTREYLAHNVNPRLALENLILNF